MSIPATNSPSGSSQSPAVWTRSKEHREVQCDPNDPDLRLSKTERIRKLNSGAWNIDRYAYIDMCKSAIARQAHLRETEAADKVKAAASRAANFAVREAAAHMIASQQRV